MPENYVNLASAPSISGLPNTGTSALFSLSAGGGAQFPSSNFRITVSNADGTNAEPMLCVSRSTDALVVNRGTSALLESPTPTVGSHAVGSIVSHNLTAGAMNQIRLDLHQQGPTASASSIQAGNTYYPTNGCNMLYDTGAALNPYGPFYEFGDPNLQTWSWINQGSATVSTTNGGIQLINNVSESPTSQPMIHGYVFSAPAVAYHVILGFTAVSLKGAATNSNLNTIVGGLFSDGTKALMCGPWDSNNFYGEWEAFYNPVFLSGGYTGFSAMADTFLAQRTPMVWIRLGDDLSTNRTFDIGPNPYTWINVLTQGRTVGLTATKVGVCINGGPSAMHLHSVTVTG